MTAKRQFDQREQQSCVLGCACRDYIPQYVYTLRMFTQGNWTMPQTHQPNVGGTFVGMGIGGNALGQRGIGRTRAWVEEERLQYDSTMAVLLNALFPKASRLQS